LENNYKYSKLKKGQWVLNQQILEETGFSIGQKIKLPMTNNQIIYIIEKEFLGEYKEKFFHDHKPLWNISITWEIVGSFSGYIGKTDETTEKRL